VIDEYLAASKRGRGRQPTLASLEKRLARIEARLHQAKPSTALRLVQQRESIRREIAAFVRRAERLAALEAQFVSIAADYGERYGIRYSTWLRAGISRDVLAAAGIKPERRGRAATSTRAEAPKRSAPKRSAA